MRDVLGKATGFGIVAVACIGGGLLAFYGPHAYNDYFNNVLAGVLILTGLGAGGLGTVSILAELQEAKQAEKAHHVEVTPRPGPLGPPPPWGMGDVGRVGGAVKGVGSAEPQGGGGPRLMAVAVSNVDGYVVVAGLLFLTLVALVLKAWLGGLDLAPGG